MAGAVAVVAWGFPKEYGLEPNNRPDADCREEPCRATGRTTGFQVRQLKQADGDRVRRFPTKVRKRNGWLVAFSLTLGDPNVEQTKFFNRLWGKPAQARISVLDPAPREGQRKNRHNRYRLVKQSRTWDVTPWFGKRAWFVLPERIHVAKGQIIALTLPTWAPVLATDLRPRERWRSSRGRDHCDELERDSAQETIGVPREYRCLHSTARLLFTALVVQKTPENERR